MKLDKPTPLEVKAARTAAGLTQTKAAKLFGYSLRAWQRKEEQGETGRSLTVGEYEMLLLLADSHPDYVLIKRE